jgi:hypothetical protein
VLVSMRMEATPFGAFHGVSRALPSVDTGGVPCRDATRLWTVPSRTPQKP